MKSQVQSRNPIEDSQDSAVIATELDQVPAWVPDGPILRFPDLLKVVGLKHSKVYELIKGDPEFPEGIPYFDSECSPRFWWTEQVLAWLKGRETKFKRRKELRS